MAAGFGNLESLELSGHRKLVAFDAASLAACTKLTSIRARGCVALRDVNAAGLAKGLLQVLDMRTRTHRHHALLPLTTLSAC